MAGLLNANQNEAAQDTSIDDPILKQIEDQIEANVPQEAKRAYQACIIAGMRVMYDEKTNQMMDEQLQQSDDIVKNVSEGIAKLVTILYSESQQKLPIPVLALASIALMAQALDYGEKKFGFQITPELVAECTKATTFAVLGAFGIDQGQIEAQMAKSQQGQSQPMPGA
jgi:hypothetical protein